MRRTVLLFGSLSLAALLVSVVLRDSVLQGRPRAAAEEEAKDERSEKKKKMKYVGVKLCRACHKDAKKGNQYGQWEKTKHAEAFKTLRSAKAKEVAARLGVENPEKDLRCLKCHVTAADKPKELTARLKHSDGVQCESCHGPGEFYSKKDIFEKGREVAMEHGLVVPDRKLCVKCHNDESPTFPGTFDFEEAWKKVLHPDPEREAARKGAGK